MEVSYQSCQIRGEPKPGKIVWLPAGDTEKEAKGQESAGVGAQKVSDVLFR